MNDDQKNYWQPDDQPDEAPADQQVVESTDQDTQASVSESIQDDAPATPQVAEEAPVTWTAQEYIHPDKGNLWYVLFAIVVIAFVAFDILLLKSWTFSALVVVMAVAVVMYIRRPPRTITYTLSSKQGLYVGERLYHFDEFKSFGLIKDGEHNSIMLIPTKRFSPGVSVYFPVEAGEKIVDVLGQRLPMQELKLDIIDLVVRKLRL